MVKFKQNFNLNRIKKDLTADFGKYRNKSNGLLLQLPFRKSIFPLTITFTKIVIEFLSNYVLNKEIVSKYFTYLKIVIDYLSK